MNEIITQYYLTAMLKYYFSSNHLKVFGTFKKKNIPRCIYFDLA